MIVGNNTQTYKHSILTSKIKLESIGMTINLYQNLQLLHYIRLKLPKEEDV